MLGNLANEGRIMANEAILKRTMYLCLPTTDIYIEERLSPITAINENVAKFQKMFPGKKTYNEEQIRQYIQEISGLLTIIYEINRQYITYFARGPWEEVSTQSFFPPKGHSIGIPASVIENGEELSIE